MHGREAEGPANDDGGRVVSQRSQPQRTVLVVEEAASIRAAVAEFLRNSGLRVLEAASGIEADAILSADMSVDVVCLHMQMPGDPDSFALAKRVQEGRPNIRLVWMAGPSGPNSHAPSSEAFNHEDLQNQIQCLLR